MNKKELNDRLMSGIGNINVSGMHALRDLAKYGNVFAYAAVMEANMESNLREDYERLTTFTSDLSLAEWYFSIQGINAVKSTIRRFMPMCLDDYKYFAELVIAVNMKAWEMDKRNEPDWSEFYSELYYIVKDLYFEYFKGNQEAIDYYFDYVD